MVPLCNVSLSGVGFSLRGRPDCLNSSMMFSLAARSYNDKYEAWEPLIEPVEGSLRYQSSPTAPGVASQLRITSTRDLNLNMSVSNANMILQAYASWNNLSHEASSSNIDGRWMATVHQRKNYYIVPQNKLGKDIYIRASEVMGLPRIIRMPAGDRKTLKMPVPDNMLDSHLKGGLLKKLPLILTIIVAEAELPKLEGFSSQQYSVGVRVYEDKNHPSQSYLRQQSARTCGTEPDGSESSDVEFVKWNEVFFFKVDSMVYVLCSSLGKDPPKHDSLVVLLAHLLQFRCFVHCEPVGYCCSSLKQLTGFQGNTDSNNYQSEFIWIDLCSGETELDATCRSLGRIKFAVLLPPRSETENFEKLFNGYRRSGSIQISPTEEGPWTTLRLNYGAPAACWRLGNDVVASEVSVNDGNRYVNLRSLVSVRNNTDFTLELCLKHRAANGVAESISGERKEAKYEECFATDEHFESQKYDSTLGWVSSTNFEGRASGLDLPAGWEWLDEWHVDNSVNRADGWVYAPDSESLKWPESYNSLRYVNYARQRRWIRNRKRAAEDFKSEIIVGPLKPGETVPLPLPCLSQSALYVLHLKPLNVEGTNQYSWSSVMDMPARSQQGERSTEISEICVSTLTETEKLLYCSEISGSSSSNLRDMWFCLSTQATEIAKDIHFNPIKDWTIVVKSPVSIANYLPLVAEISLLEMQASGHFLACYRGVLGSGETVKVYNADIRNPLYFSLLPQRGWLPQQEAVPLSDSNNSPSKTINLRSSVSGRIVQIILEQNHTNERPLQPKIIKVFSPFWLGIARCPPLSFRLVDVNARRSKKNPLSLQTKKVKEIVLEEITEEEIHEGYTIASALNFKALGLSVSIGQSGGEQFGPVKDLSPLGAMDGSLDLFAYNADGNCMQLFVSSKPCPYQSVPTKVRMHDTDWSFPIQIGKEDTVTLVLKKHDGTRRFLRTEIRGFEEGSRFIVVFRLGSANGPIRIENRTRNCTVRFRQTGFGEDAWIQLQPLSTAKFSWEDPYGQKVIDTEVYSGNDTGVFKFDLDKARFSSIGDNSGLFLHIENIGDIKVVKFMNIYALLSTPKEGSGSLLLGGNSHITAKMPEQGSPLELIVELGVVGISVVDHKPRELVYLYMEKFFISYLTGYDGGTTSRFKLILGYIQLDNQLPLTVMPVLLAPEQTPDVHHPVFKMTVTVRNENLDGLQIYPYVYIRVIDKSWRLSIHEPIIWALVDFFNNLQLDRIPQNSSVTQVDPEIRVDLIDISEVRLKVTLETAPAQRPHGLLGVWGPVLSAVGNAFKIQVHLRKVTHRDRFLRKSAVISAIGNRIWRDLIHNPLHLIFSVDVLGMTSSTLASLSKGFAELSTDGQFLQLRSKQVWSRRITGVGDGIVQGTEALAQGFAFGVSGVVRKPVESARQNGLLGLAHGLGQAFLVFLYSHEFGIHGYFILTMYYESTREREALGQMILYLAEASRNFGCTEIFKEPSKFAWSDCYEEHFVVPYHRIVLVTNRRVMLVQCVAPDKMDKKPCKIMWDVPWEEVMALELAKAGYPSPSHLIVHLKSFRRGESFVRVIKCNTEQVSEEGQPQAVRVCSVVRKMEGTPDLYETGQRHVSSLNEVDVTESHKQHRAIITSTTISSSGSVSNEQKLVEHSINFARIWSSDRESKGRCTLCRKQSLDSDEICSIWRPVCPDGYVSIGDIARSGSHPPNVAAIYRKSEMFALPVGYDLGYVALGCVAVPSFSEPELDYVYCIAESICEETTFEQQKIWSAPDSYPWACHIYQVHSDALHFVALRQPREESDWKPKRVIDNPQLSGQTSDAQ
ncbi:UNVERIFIED_CONTAM: putative vacuolar protein sorting-associated protein 13D [Sesamum calycinum]|uniref:Vacuolar protein sorting-associated protein 13D n=1 Tax=Sesamum calycinum TaxID=2727403 RepID=A0AAW2QYT7_9LAMI